MTDKKRRRSDGMIEKEIIINGHKVKAIVPESWLETEKMSKNGEQKQWERNYRRL